MEKVIEQLQRRYGSEHDYEILTDKQREILLASKVMDAEDTRGKRMVRVEEIRDTPVNPTLSLADVFSYEGFRNQRNWGTHARMRLPSYRDLTGTSEEPMEKRRTYAFSLDDGSRLEVEFGTVREGE